MNVERLTMLRDLLLNLPEKLPELVAFDMGLWTYQIDRDIEEILDPVHWLREGECGTACCALGSAALYPPFQAAGLRLDNGDVRYRNRAGIDAAVEFFDISKDFAESLFYPRSYRNSFDPNPITPEEVAERISKVLP